jgi:predicted transcriptional regulator of viral defense system
LAYHARTGAFHRIGRGLYRFRDFPSTPREEVVAAWLAAGPESAVVSHESALDLWDLGDPIPDVIHLTVPRTRRHLPRLPGVRFHTTTRPLEAGDVRVYEGARVTTPARTFLDLAETGTVDDHLGYAVRQAIGRGWTTADELRAAARERGGRAERGIARSLATDAGKHQNEEHGEGR